MQISPYTLISDAGHGWLAVPVKELERLDIQAQISDCSPERDGLRFLETDCDYALYLETLAARGEEAPATTRLEVGDFWEEVLGTPRHLRWQSRAI